MTVFQKFRHLSKNLIAARFRRFPDGKKADGAPPETVRSRPREGRWVRVGRGNDSAAKVYRARYEAVRAQARFPAALVERVYGSRFARHFWSEAERGAFARRWLGGDA